MSDPLKREQIEKLLQFQQEEFPDLHQAASDENIIFFIGAGVSKLYGCLLWEEMAVKLVEDLRKANILNYAERDILLKDTRANPRKVISICYKKCSDVDDNRKIYEEAIKDSVKIREFGKVQDIYKKIFSVKASAHITTNIDDGLKEYALDKKEAGDKLKIYNCTLPNDRERIKQVDYNIFKDGTIIYLHGNISCIQECVLPIEKYLSHYSENNSFLNGLFSKIKTMKGIIFFLGYGLGEWDIIERIYKVKDFPNERVAYLMSPIFTHEMTKFNLEMDYYKSFGVEAIPYIIDEGGYERINFVLDNLGKAIDKSVPAPYKIFSEIDEAGKYAE